VRSGASRANPKRGAAAKQRVAKARAAKGPAAKGRAAKPRAARRVTAQRTPAKRRAVARAPRARAGHAPAIAPAFAAQRAHATSREELLFELARARAVVKAAIQGLSAANAGKPIGPGKWSPLEIVLHLGERDRVRLEEFRRTLSGRPRSWAGISDPDMAAVNEAHLVPLRAHSWDDAVRRLDALREALLLRLNEVPALPDDVWQRGHAFADMMWGLPEHDRHHAGQIKQARIGDALPVED